MRQIRFSQICVFAALFSLTMMLGIGITALVFGGLFLGDFRGIFLFAVCVILTYISGILVYRLFLYVAPLHAGEITEGSRQEFIYHVYVLFYLILFYPIMRSGFVPTPIMRLFYLALGTKMGKNTYSQGIIHDPPFIEIGDNCTIGQYALLIPHVIEGDRLAHFPINLGNHVTVGAHAVVLSGVVIGDHAIVATGAVVLKGTRIGPGEVWGGVPARRLKTGAQAPQA